MKGTIRIKFDFYDSEKKLLSSTNSNFNNLNSPTQDNIWYCSPYSKSAIVPNNATFFKVTFMFGNINNSNIEAEGTQYKIGGLVVN